MTADPRPPRMSDAERLLGVQLEQADIPFEREFVFAKKWGRKWRADFRIGQGWTFSGGNEITRWQALLVEIDGGAFIAGRHSRGKGVEADAEKQSAAAILGYRVIRATPRQVEDGRCLSWIRQALGLEANRDAA